MNTPKELIEKIIAAGYSQTYISDKTGISQPTISRILSGGHTDPKSSTLTKLQHFAAAHLAQPTV